MKSSNLYVIVFLLFLLCPLNEIKAQYYCFWLYNLTGETLAGVRLKETGTTGFGDDVFEADVIEPYKAYAIRTPYSESSVFDVQVINMEGQQIRFSWVGQDGNSYNKPYMTIDISPLNTFVVNTDDYGNY